MRRFAALYLCALIAFGLLSGTRSRAQSASAQDSPAELLRLGAASRNFLYGSVAPWHLRATYTMMNSSGKKGITGTYEMFWAGPDKIRQSYESKTLSQVDYTTGKSILRSGDLQWPSMLEQRIPDFLFLGLPNPAVLSNFDVRAGPHLVNGANLRCVRLEMRADAPQWTTIAPTYCFDPESPVLRFASGAGSNLIEQLSSIQFSNLFLFRGHPVNRDIAVTFMDRLTLNVHIDTMEDLPAGSDSIFVPPPNATAPGPRPTYLDQRHMESRIAKRGTANLGISANGRGFDGRGMLDVFIGKDGLVKSVRPLVGPEIYEGGEIHAMQKQIYQPVLINGVAVEVETEVAYQLSAR